MLPLSALYVTMRLLISLVCWYNAAGACCCACAVELTAAHAVNTHTILVIAFLPIMLYAVYLSPLRVERCYIHRSRYALHQLTYQLAGTCTQADTQHGMPGGNG